MKLADAVNHLYRAQKFDAQFWTTIRRFVLRIALSLTRDPDRSQDVAQQVQLDLLEFIRAGKRQDDSRGRFSDLLAAITRYSVANSWKVKKRITLIDDLVADPDQQFSTESRLSLFAGDCDDTVDVLRREAESADADAKLASLRQTVGAKSQQLFDEYVDGRRLSDAAKKLGLRYAQANYRAFEWRPIVDSIQPRKDTRASRYRPAHVASLRPGPTLMFAALHEDDIAAHAIRDAWRFNLPVRVMDADEFDRLVSR